MSRVVVAEFRSAPDRPWYVWGVYDSIPTLREEAIKMEMVVPLARVSDRWKAHPWQWVSPWGNEYRATQRTLIERKGRA